MKRLVILFLGLIIYFTLFSKDIKTVCGEYEYHVPPNQTIEQAKAIALKRAQTVAIENELGSTISQNNTTLIKNDGTTSSVDFFSNSQSRIKGEWIETIGEPEYSITYVNNEVIIRVSVKGKIKETATNFIDIDARVLCNGTTSQHERTEFYNGDDFFMSIVSPVEGNVLIYMVDYNKQEAYCMLPYIRDREPSRKIKKDKKYIFFSPDKDDSPSVDEYMMTCEGEQEALEIYVIFSKAPLTKARKQMAYTTDLQFLTFPDFNKWISELYSRYDDLSVTRIPIIIKAKSQIY